MRLTSFLICTTALASLPALAEDARQLDAHVHGAGALNIAIEGALMAIELEIPGFDLVGFEYEASREEDKAAVRAALVTLSDPLNIMALPEAAGCAVTDAAVDIETEGEGHDDHGHDDHDDHSGDKDHDAHAEGEASHNEYHAAYLLTCDDVSALTSLELTYFAQFDNAEELEVQVVTDKGAFLMEATPDAPVLDLGEAM